MSGRQNGVALGTNKKSRSGKKVMATSSRKEIHIERVKRVAQLREQGLTDKLIAERLGLAPSSVTELLKEARIMSANVLAEGKRESQAKGA